MSYYSEKQYSSHSNHHDKLYYEMHFERGQKILDIGCSTGGFLVQDKDNIVGIDVDKDALKFAKEKGLNVKYCDATKKLNFKDNEFDVVNSRHLLEHLDNPLKFVKEIRRVLKAGGKAVVLTDAMSKDFWHDYTHKRPFTLVSLRRLFYDAGFKQAKCYNLPVGIPFMGVLYRRGIVSAKKVKKIAMIVGRISKEQNLVVEAIK